jgi:hypothetical protein
MSLKMESPLRPPDHVCSWEQSEKRELPIVQRKATRPGNVQTGSEQGGYDLSVEDRLFDDCVYIVLSDPTVPDRLPRGSIDLRSEMLDAG